MHIGSLINPIYKYVSQGESNQIRITNMCPNKLTTFLRTPLQSKISISYILFVYFPKTKAKKKSHQGQVAFIGKTY